MRRAHRLFACAWAACAALPAGAQTVADDSVLPAVEIRSRKNAGDAPYAAAYQLQQRVMALLPPEPRLIDLRLRVMFVDLTLRERDDFMPPNWGVAIVGTTIDEVIPMARGGYFLLPDRPLARGENATVMFNTQTKVNFIGMTWSVRVREGNLLPYRDFAQALAQFDAAKRKVHWYQRGLAEFSQVRMSALRACFVGQGAVLLDGAASGAVLQGRCWILGFDQARAASDAVISFNGELESLTLH